LSEAHNIHATGLMLGGRGLILRGPSGAGKSLLALELLDDWEARGEAARLVADDRIDVLVGAGGLTMRAPQAIAGLIELRGRGIVRRPFAESAPLELVIDLVETVERLPGDAEFSTELFGVEVMRAPVPRAGLIDARHQLLLIREAVRSLAPHTRQKTT